MKKSIVWLLVFAMVFALAGCQNQGGETTPTTTAAPTTEPTTEPTTVPTEPPMTAERLAELMEPVLEAMENNSGDITIDLGMTIKMAVEGVNMNMNYTIGVAGSYIGEPETENMYMDLVMSLSLMGQSTEQAMQMYMISDGELTHAYSYDVTNDMWNYSSEADEEDTDEDFDPLKDAVSMTLDEETLLTDGKEVYVLRLQVPADKASAVTGLATSMLGADDSGVDLAGIELPMVIHVDVTTLEMVYYEMDLSPLQEPLGASIAAAMGTDTTEMDASISFSEFSISETVAPGVVEFPAVPEEALMYAKQLSFNPDMGDGTYVIQEMGDAVRITKPKGWTVNPEEGDLTYYSVYMLKNDYTKDAYFEIADITGEDIVAYVDALAAQMQAYGLYTAHGQGDEIDGYQTAYLTADGLTYYFAWRDAGEHTLYINVTVLEGVKPKKALEPIFELVEDYQLPTEEEVPAETTAQ